MTSLFTARRRAEEFAAVVDAEPRDRAAVAADVAEFLGIVAVLRSQDVEPRPEFTGQLRARLLAEAQVALTPQAANLQLPVRRRGPRERRLVAAASAVVLVGGTATMAAAAQSSLPGEALYPIKRGIERAEAGLSMSDAGKGEDLLSQANARLTEVDGLLVSDTVQSDPLVPSTLTDFSTQADEGSALLLESFEQTGDPTSVSTVRSFAADAISTLEALADDVPAAAQDELAAAASTLRDIDQQATSLCDTCLPGLPAVQVPDMMAARAEVNRALRTVAFRQLDNSHPVVVPRGATGTGSARVQVNRPEPGPKKAPAKGPGDAGTQAPPDQPNADPTLPAPTLPGVDDPVAGGKTLTEELPALPLLPSPSAPAEAKKPPKKSDDGPELPVVTLLPDLGDSELLP